ncbi:subtilisin-like protein [Xylariaceae sp. FL0662B]|nr:subtilisin-like protein [Xylariaceae sp. FL0662B]
MKTFNFLILALAPLALALAPLVNRDLEDGIADNYVVVMKKDADPKTVQAHYGHIHAASRLVSKGKKGVVKTFQVHGFNAYHVECDAATLQTIRKTPAVDYVAQDQKVTVQAALGQPIARQTPNTWGLGRISHRQPGISVYVDQSAPRTRAYILDTGIRVTHKEFSGRAIWGKNFIQGSQDVDDNGHGTHTAGTVGGNTVGVDNSTTLIAVKVLDANSTGSWSGLISGIQWAVNDAQQQGSIARSVINMSIGGPKYQALNDCIKNAVAAGMTIVTAASNYGADACTYSPASAPEAITVAATDETDTRPDWSNWGTCVDIFAPGNNIYSAWKDSDSAYLTLSGTSMASPHVAGLTTYLMSREQLSTPASVVNRMLQLGTSGKVKNAKGSPNLITFNGNAAEL